MNWGCCSCVILTLWDKDWSAKTFSASVRWRITVAITRQRAACSSSSSGGDTTSVNNMHPQTPARRRSATQAAAPCSISNPFILISMRRYRGVDARQADAASEIASNNASKPTWAAGHPPARRRSVIWRHAVPTAGAWQPTPVVRRIERPPAGVGEGDSGKATAGPYWLSICRPRWQATADLQSDHISRRRWADDDVTPVRSSSNSINGRPQQHSAYANDNASYFQSAISSFTVRVDEWTRVNDKVDNFIVPGGQWRRPSGAV